jgi:hypothetical protein
MKNMTFEEIQSKLNETLRLAEVKVGTKKADLIERVYLKALRDAGMDVPVVVDVLLMSGRSVAGYKPSNIGKRVQLGYDHGEDVEELEEK